jgi:biopolymer transport protein ExbD
MRVKRHESDGEEAQVQMAPLIDCVFILLIFFIVTASLKKIHKEVPLELPEFGAKIDAKDPEETLVISVDRKGDVYLAGTPIDKMELEKRLQEAYMKNPRTKVRIDADKHTRFQNVAYVIDLCQFHNLRHVGVRAAQ